MQTSFVLTSCITCKLALPNARGRSKTARGGREEGRLLSRVIFRVTSHDNPPNGKPARKLLIKSWQGYYRSESTNLMIIPRLLTIFTDQFYFSIFHLKVLFIWGKLVPGGRVLRLPELPWVNHFSYISARRLTLMAFHGSNNFYPTAGRDSVKARQA